jgi:hypothetical protein
VQQAGEALGVIDILVNNAGILKPGDILTTTLEDFDAVLAVNVRAVFVIGQAVAQALVAAGKPGAIINMSSVNAVLAIPGQLPYVTSKGAINQLTKTMALGLAEHGIRVNAIGPGTIATEILKGVFKDEAAKRGVLARTPLKRIGEPREIGRVAVFLASEDASYMTGQTIYPDGGRLALNYTVAWISRRGHVPQVRVPVRRRSSRGHVPKAVHVPYRGFTASGRSSNSVGVSPTFAPSIDSIFSLVSTPPGAEKPPGLPLAPSTRWQGMRIGKGLRPMASPTARAASRGSPMAWAISP